MASELGETENDVLELYEIYVDYVQLQSFSTDVQERHDHCLGSPQSHNDDNNTRYVDVIADVVEVSGSTTDSAVLTTEAVYRQDEDGDTQLHVAVIFGQWRLFEHILGKLTPYSGYLDYQNALKQTALHLAVITDQPLMVRALRMSGASLALRDHHGNTPLHAACEFDRRDCLAAMLYWPTDAELEILPCVRFSRHTWVGRRQDWARTIDTLNYEGYACLHLAGLRKCHNLVEILLRFGASINIPDGKSGRTLLHHAAERDDQVLVNLLLRRLDVEINAHAWHGFGLGYTPLEVARGASKRLLLEAGADEGYLDTEDASNDSDTSEVNDTETFNLWELPNDEEIWAEDIKVAKERTCRLTLPPHSNVREYNRTDVLQLLSSRCAMWDLEAVYRTENPDEWFVSFRSHPPAVDFAHVKIQVGNSTVRPKLLRTSEFKVHIHWLPDFIPDDMVKDGLEKSGLGEVTAVTRIQDDKKIRTGTRTAYILPDKDMDVEFPRVVHVGGYKAEVLIPSRGYICHYCCTLNFRVPDFESVKSDVLQFMETFSGTVNCSETKEQQEESQHIETDTRDPEENAQENTSGETNYADIQEFRTDAYQPHSKAVSIIGDATGMESPQSDRSFADSCGHRTHSSSSEENYARQIMSPATSSSDNGVDSSDDSSESSTRNSKDGATSLESVTMENGDISHAKAIVSDKINMTKVCLSNTENDHITPQEEHNYMSNLDLQQ